VLKISAIAKQQNIGSHIEQPTQQLNNKTNEQ
jgi:hypothetical protein